MAINVVHFSKSSLAGAPINLVKTLNKQDAYQVNLIDLERWDIYDNDLVFSENVDKCIELANRADIIHLHNYLDIESKDFDPIDFKALKSKGKIFVRQFHSHPEFIARIMNTSVSALLNSPVPSLVVAQFQERYYPKARVVPNIIHQENLQSNSLDKQGSGIFFSPTNVSGAWVDRWNTKGMPETIELIKKVALLTGCQTTIVNNRSFEDIIQEKAKSCLVVDELVTGSYHLSGLEGLFLGKPVLSYLDHRVQYVMSHISGAITLPFINVRLEEALDVLVYLLKNPSEMVSIGTASREWAERYWNENVLVGHYIDVYEKLLHDPTTVVRQDSLKIDSPADQFYSIVLPDLTHQSRSKECEKETFSFSRLSETLRRKLSCMMEGFFNYLRQLH